MKYYTIQKGGLLIAKNREALERYYPADEVFELPEDYEQGKYIVEDGELLLNPNWEEEQTQKRQKDFDNEFLSTSLGNYRLNPRGYANAQQSIDTINANVQYAQGLTAEIAELVIFYPTPDFSKAEECTEEWLVAHQYNPEPMTLQQWAMFYIEFSRAYAAKKYQQSLKENMNE